MVKVVVHVSEAEKFSGALSNVKNLIKATEETLTIEVVANSQGVKAYLEPDYQAKVMVLRASGVTFSACQNSLNSLEINVADLLEGVEVVPAGIYRLVELQEDSYRYIKA